MRVAVFTDTDFDTMNGITTTLRAVLRHAPPDVKPRIYTLADLEIDEPDYLALKTFALPTPFARSGRMFLPRLQAFQRRLAADDIQLIHVTSPGPAGLAARLLARRTGLPLVGTAHRSLVETSAVGHSASRSRGLRQRYLRWIFTGCSRLLVPSADAGRRLSAAGWDADRLVVWPCGVDAVRFAPAKRSSRLRDVWHVSDRRPAILYTGRLAPEKGLAVIEPLGSLLHQRGVAHRFVLAGEGPMAAALKERCPDAVFTDRVSPQDLPTVVASADVLLFPEGTFTCGSAVLEAQAGGLPVVVSTAGGAREYMRHNETGFACRPGDLADLANRLSALLLDARLRHAMSVAARRYAESRPWPAALSPLYALYRSTVERGRGDAAATPRRFGDPAAAMPAVRMPR